MTELLLVYEGGDGEDIIEANGRTFQGRRMVGNIKCCGKSKRKNTELLWRLRGHWASTRG